MPRGASEDSVGREPSGAGWLLLTDPRRGVLLRRRASEAGHGGPWAPLGAPGPSGESPVATAIGTVEWEAGVGPRAVRVLAAVEEPDTRGRTVLATLREEGESRGPADPDVSVRWVRPDEVEPSELPSGLAAAWPELRGQLARRAVLVVDSANVVGSRPDGWWRDRAGATARLRDRLAVVAARGVVAPRLGLDLGRHWRWWPRVVLVTEGRARGVGGVPGVEVVEAPGDGDDTVVRVVARLRASGPRDHVVVATADRALRRRVGEHGCAVLGPAELWDVLDESGPA
ncbi:NUDIX domain-containing protein [Saccharomonospora glauca]|jgi:8-oxo-dGTP diphosphatase|uniref:ADP-ribose pyrophosphatase n=1 Tax=Saccharomonospora glauca K62 TaxID=928724 RepID=I1D406_9PSEU|nr:NUDIX domain-containing protein [Saccharomonospora glauca]EIE99680.1 ADP-ribose pyrophosphatase [Saccharomonospora glauca K62]